MKVYQEAMHVPEISTTERYRSLLLNVRHGKFGVSMPCYDWFLGHLIKSIIIRPD